jgi:lipopolysaccharide transport system permease protein
LVLLTGSSIALGGIFMLGLVVVLLGLIAAALGFMFGPINVRWRDITLTLPFIMRIMFFTTPIWYPFSLIPAEYQDLFLLNPIVAAMELVRNAFFDPSAVDISLIGTATIEVVILLAIGIPVFKKTKTIMADYY